ncbi:hypothetical protein RND71_000442 [Anisodus tanguticus]|uniref:GH10 domain-containing protein n=1 Tax=Anisodus tanguticus TaxID=243964 RepID=A0AAE1VXX7_9SOLA|nr:hypothetical protein RND71_000442 [Anisodus tanguticus]
MGRGRNCYMATLGNNGFILFCSLFLAGYFVHGSTPYDYSATIECLKQPLDPQYGGGLIANPGFDKDIEAWEVDGRVKIETRQSGGNKFIVAYNRTDPFTWVQLSEGSDIVVAMIYNSVQEKVTTVGSVIAKSGGWSMIKGGLTVDQNVPAVLHFQCNHTKSDLRVDSVSLKEFTKHEWQENRFTTAVFDNEMKWYYVEGLQGRENYSTPDAMLKFFEDHGIDVYVEKLQEIKAFPWNEELVIGIGLQGHFDSHPNIPYVRAVLDVLGETKMPIWLTELNVEPCPKHAYFLEEIMREAYAHPAVKGMMIWIGWKPDECNEMYNAGALRSRFSHGDYCVTVYNPNTGANFTKEVKVYDENSETLDVLITL